MNTHNSNRPVSFRFIQCFWTPFYDRPVLSIPEYLPKKLVSGYKCSEEEYDIINSIFWLDYTEGNAEFSFGLFCKTLQKANELGQSNKMTRLVLEVSGEPYTLFSEDRPLDAVKKTAKLYGFTQKDQTDVVTKFIELNLKDSYPRVDNAEMFVHLKADTKMQHGVFGSYHRKRHETVWSQPTIDGWFDITNYWMFTTRKDLADQACKLLSIS